MRTQFLGSLSSKEPLIYKMMIKAESRWGTIGDWQPYERVFGKDSDLIEELSNRLGLKRRNAVRSETRSLPLVSGKDVVHDVAAVGDRNWPPKEILHRHVRIDAEQVIDGGYQVGWRDFSGGGESRVFVGRPVYVSLLYPASC